MPTPPTTAPTSSRAWDRASAIAQAIIETSPLAIVVFDRDSRIIVWNRAAERLFGWRATEVLGHPFPNEAIPPNELEPARLRTRRMIDGAVIQAEPSRRYSRDGRELILEVHGRAIRDRAGEAIAFLDQMVDVTPKT